MSWGLSDVEKREAWGAEGARCGAWQSVSGRARAQGGDRIRRQGTRRQGRARGARSGDRGQKGQRCTIWVVGNTECGIAKEDEVGGA